MKSHKNYLNVNQRNIKKRSIVRLTDYYKRFKMLKSGEKRLVVRKTNKYVTAQLVEFNVLGDHVLWSASTRSIVLDGRATSGTSHVTCQILGSELPLTQSDSFIVDIGMRRPKVGSPFFVWAVMRGLEPKLSELQKKRIKTL